MEMCYSVVVLLLLSIASHGVLADICDSCQCQPPAAPVSVACVCRNSQQPLVFRPGDFTSKFAATRNFTISNCNNAISFKQNLFKELHQLDTLQIHNVKRVVFEIGVFQTLNNLILHNISTLNFKSNAFHGSQMRNVEIRHSNISDLPQFAFHDISSLSKFEFFDVHIISIQSDAILLKNNKAVGIIRTTIEEMSSNAIVIDTEHASISDSILNNVNPAAVNITSKGSIIISGNEFDENLSDNPIIGIAPIVNITDNIFKRLTPQIIRNIRGESNGHMYFVNNTIEKIDSDTPINIPSSRWHISGNQFKCTCDMLKILVNFKNSDIIENNYCLLSKCRVPLSKGEAKCERQSPANLDNTDICDGVPTVAPLQPRGGRGMGFPMEDFDGTTHLPFMSTTQKSSASMQVVSIFLSWSFIALILL